MHKGSTPNKNRSDGLARIIYVRIYKSNPTIRLPGYYPAASSTVQCHARHAGFSFNQQSPSNLTCRWCQLLASLRIQVCLRTGLPLLRMGLEPSILGMGSGFLGYICLLGRIKIKKPEHTKKITNFEISLVNFNFRVFTPPSFTFFGGFHSFSIRESREFNMLSLR